MTNEEVDKYWAMYIKKIWIVKLIGGKRKEEVSDRIIVRAESNEAAIIAARLNSFVIKGRHRAYARLADPESDLGATKSLQPSKPWVHNLTKSGIEHFYPPRKAA